MLQIFRAYVLYSRVEWFWKKKKIYTIYDVPNCCWTSIPKFHVLMLPLALVVNENENFVARETLKCLAEIADFLELSS